MSIKFNSKYDDELKKLFKDEFSNRVKKLKDFGEMNNKMEFTEFLNETFNVYAITLYELKYNQINHIFEETYYNKKEEITESEFDKLIISNEKIKQSCEKNLNLFLNTPYEDKVKYYAANIVDMNYKTLLEVKPVLNYYLLNKDLDKTTVSDETITEENLIKLNTFNTITEKLQDNFIKENKRDLSTTYNIANKKESIIENYLEKIKNRVKMKM